MIAVDHQPTQTYIAFLRGINVGGHKKVPMATLREVLEKAGYTNVITLLNSGNVIFSSPATAVETLESDLARLFEDIFGFPVPTLVREARAIQQLLDREPFATITLAPQIRRYITFLKHPAVQLPSLPWSSPDGSFTIWEASPDHVISMLDLGISGTPQAMEALEQMVGAEATTRNWNTILRIGKKLGDIRISSNE